MKKQPIENWQGKKREQVELAATVTIAAVIGIFFFVIAVYTIKTFF